MSFTQNSMFESQAGVNGFPLDSRDFAMLAVSSTMTLNPLNYTMMEEWDDDDVKGEVVEREPDLEDDGSPPSQHENGDGDDEFTQYLFGKDGD